MAKKIIWLGAFLALVILSASFYIFMPEKIRIDFTKTRTIFTIYNPETGKFDDTQAIEYTRIFDGTILMRAKNRNITYNIKDGITEWYRIAKFKEDIIVEDFVEFSNEVTDVENVPVSHKACFTNAQGKIFEYLISNIEYGGESKPITSPFRFGKNMKVTFQDGHHIAKVVNNKVRPDKIIVRYRIKSDYECFDIRLFDPEEDIIYTPSHTIGTYCNSFYNPTSKVMKDTSCLEFKAETNGVITINDERYLAFALKGIVGGNEIKRTSMDFSWTWHMEESNGDYIFWAENDNPNFIWKQYYYFYKDHTKPMKIKHYLENNLADITNAQIYYLTNVLPEDSIEYNGTSYLVNDYMGLHKQGEFNDLISVINFNSEYGFNFEDLVDNGFDINEFYIGSGSVIGKPNIDITAIGFTKNNGNFPKGGSVWVDPTFSTSSAEAPWVSPLTNDTFVIAWCDEIADDVFFQVYNTSGTTIGSQVTVDNAVSRCDDYSVSVSALNSTAFVVGYADSADGHASFRVYQSDGTALTDTIDASLEIGSSNVVSVSSFNSSRLVIGWFDDDVDDATFRIYQSNGTALTGEIDADDAIGGSNAVAVSAFNSTAFAIAWWDNIDSDATFSIYDSSGSLVVGPIDVASVSWTYSIAVGSINSSHIIVGLYDGSNSAFRVYLTNGTPVTSKISVDSVGTYKYGTQTPVAALNSSHMVIGWWDATENDASVRVYQTDGTPVTGVIDSSLDSLNWQSVASELPTVDIGICNNNFIHAYVVSTSLSEWLAYQPNGSRWDGCCDYTCPDITAPTFSDDQTNTSSITTFNGTDVQINLTIDDGYFGAIDFYRIATNNTVGNTLANQSLIDAGGATSLTAIFNESILHFSPTTDGTFGWQVWANDSAGNIGISGIYTFTVYLRPPPGFSNPQTNASSITFNGSDIQINITASDLDTGIDSCILSTNDTSGNTWGNKTTITFGGGSPVTAIWNETIVYFPLEGGTYGWKAQCNDTLGYSNISNIYTFTVQDLTTPPTFSNNKTNASLTTYNATDVQINLTITDVGGGVDSYILSTNDSSGNAWSNKSIQDGNGASSITAIFNETIAWFPTGGTFGWQVWANDSLGNADVSDIYTFLVNYYVLNIIQPTTSTPSSVSGGDNISINFTFQNVGVNLTSGVTMENVTIGGINATIITDTNCIGTLDCSAYSTEVTCENCSQCDWSTISAAALEFETFESSYGNWDYDDGDPGCDFLRDQDGTPSTGTGPQPQGSAPGANGTDFYVFVETSGGQCDDGEQAYLVGPNVSLTDYPNSQLDFSYSMYGANMGTLNVQLNTSGTWSTIWTISGDQGISPVWTGKSIDLSEYSGVLAVRFEYDRDTVSGYTADVALDHINISQGGSIGCVEIGSCSACVIDECDTNCSAAGCSLDYPQQFGYTGNWWSVNVTVPSGLTGLQDLFLNATYSGITRSDTQTEAINYEVVGETSINFTIWDGSTWVGITTEDIEFRCTSTQKNCEPTNQDAGNSQSIYRICNNGTISGTDVYMNMNVTFVGIDLFCDDDYTAAGGTNLTTSNQTIHGELIVDACTDISCWANYSSPTSGGYFDVRGYVVSS